MALHVPKPPGYSQMMKDGAKQYQGLEDAVYRNIDACVELAQTTRTAFGPNGQNKIVINHISRLFVTKDAATILRELEVAHPAAKMMVLATQEQEQEAGDGTNYVFILAGALLQKAEEMLQMGLTVTEVIAGYELSAKKALEILETLVVDKVKDIRNEQKVGQVIQTAVMSKQHGHEIFLADLISKACITCLTDKNGFNTDNVRICKVLGAGVVNSLVLQGMVFKRSTEGGIREAKDAKVAVYSCPLDALQTETKGTILIETAEQLKDYSRGEENLLDQFVKGVVESGCKVVVSGGKVGEMMMHYCNKYDLMVVRVNSKWDIRRLCSALGATVIPSLQPPTHADLGFVGFVRTEEIGENNVVIFQQLKNVGNVSTIVVRGSTENIMEDIERAVDDGVNTFKCLTQDKRLLPGAGATEIELAIKLTEEAEKYSDMTQYAMHRFAQSFESIVKALAENAGMNGNSVVAELYACHQKGEKKMGLVFTGEQPTVANAAKANILDVYRVRYWSIKFAAAVACTILSVDQVIMAKPAGGPKTDE